MKHQPIGPGLHGLMDYGFMTMHLLAPTVLKLDTSASALSYSFAGLAGSLAGLTDQPYAVQRVIPFKTHGAIETAVLPTILLLPLLTGDLKKPKARAFFLASFGMALANFLLTDFKGKNRKTANR